MELLHSESFKVYAVFAVVLSILSMTLDALGGIARAKTGIVLNPEDTKIVPGANVVEGDPSIVGRVMRAHRNAFSNIVPFLVVAFLYVATGAAAKTATIFFSVFTGARVIHPIAYALRLQPLRTVVFAVGQGVILVLSFLVLRAVLI